VRNAQPLGLVLDVAQEQDVDVDRARAVPDAAGAPAELGLDPLALGEQLLGAQLGLDLGDGVEEVALVEDLALRRGLVDRRDAERAELLRGGRQVGASVPDVRAEAEVGPQPLPPI